MYQEKLHHVPRWQPIHSYERCSLGTHTEKHFHTSAFLSMLTMVLLQPSRLTACAFKTSSDFLLAYHTHEWHKIIIFTGLQLLIVYGEKVVLHIIC